MLLIKPKDTRFHKQRLRTNLSFLRLSTVDQFIRLMERSITGMKDCSWSSNCSAVAEEILICRAEDVRDLCSTGWSRKDNKLSWKPLTFNKPISLWWMCSWAQEEIWKISYNVPRPPGKAMKASTWLNIAFIRSDIVETCSSSPIVFPLMSHFAKALGTTPKTWLPPKNTAIDTPPPLTQGCLPHTLNESFSQLVPDQDDLLILKTLFLSQD